MYRKFALALAFACTWVAAGCHGPQKRVIGHSVEGRRIEALSFGRGADRVLIMATIHGDEDAGTPLVQRLADELRREPRWLEGRRVVLIPVANPDGRARRTRENVRGIDLNRNFPAGNFTVTAAHGSEPLSEPETRALKTVLHGDIPGRIVTIHQPLECVDWDGPGERLARAMGEWTDLPVKRLGSRPGSLGSYAGETLGVPIVTLELPASASSLDADALWQRYGRMLLAAICFPENLNDRGLRPGR